MANDNKKRVFRHGHKRTYEETDYRERFVVQQFTVSAQPKFLKTYPGIIMLLKEMTKRGVSVYFAMAMEAERGTNIVTLSDELRQTILKSCGLQKKQSLYNVITQLKKKNALAIQKRGFYMLNPEVTFIGDESERIKAIEKFKRLTTGKNG